MNWYLYEKLFYMSDHGLQLNPPSPHPHPPTPPPARASLHLSHSFITLLDLGVFNLSLYKDDKNYNPHRLPTVYSRCYVFFFSRSQGSKKQRKKSIRVNVCVKSFNKEMKCLRTYTEVKVRRCRLNVPKY